MTLLAGSKGLRKRGDRIRVITIMGYIGDIWGYRIISIPNLRPFWHYSPCKPPFRVTSGEVALNGPGQRDPEKEVIVWMHALWHIGVILLILKTQHDLSIP